VLKVRVWLVLSQVLASLVCGQAFGQVTAAAGTEEIAQETVEIKGVKDPDAFNVKDGLALKSKFSRIPVVEREKVRLGFYVQGKRGEMAPANLRLSLNIGMTDEVKPLRILETGEVVLPEIAPEDAESGEILASVRRGSIRIVYFVGIVVPDRGLTGRYLREALVQARSAWRALYGPVMGLTVPAFTCAEAHFMSQGLVIANRAGVEVWRSGPAKSVQVPLESVGDDDRIEIQSGRLVRWGGCVTKKVGSEP
jgi:hypothetical protein